MTYERDVFINCPFDASYRPILRGLLFAVHDCGFKARSASEVVRNWLSTTVPAQGIVIPSGSVIAGRYKQFRRALPAGCERRQLNPRRLTFGDVVTLVVGWLTENPWKP